MTEPILWRRLDQPGHEFARLTCQDSSPCLNGTAVFLWDRQPCRLDYRVICDAHWHTVAGKVTGFVGNKSIDIECTVDSGCHWRLNGKDQPAVAGCIDFDLNFSPSTNLLPIRRLNLPSEKRPWCAPPGCVFRASISRCSIRSTGGPENRSIDTRAREVNSSPISRWIRKGLSPGIQTFGKSNEVLQ